MTKNHMAHFLVTFMTMFQLLGFSFFQWDDFSHYFHFRRPLYGPLVVKVNKKRSLIPMYTLSTPHPLRYIHVLFLRTSYSLKNYYCILTSY
jgi:hypothetical protein